MMTALLQLLLILPSARAACDVPSVHVVAAERAVLAVERPKAAAELEQAMGAMACSPPVDVETLARFWLATAVLAKIDGDEARSKEAFLAAWRLAPGVWLPGYGDAMEQTRNRVVKELSNRPNGRLILSAPPQHSQIWLDGRQVVPPLDLEAGLHLVQLAPAGGVPYFQRSFVLPAGEDLSMTVDAVEPAAPPPPPPPVEARKGTVKAPPEPEPPPEPDPARIEEAKADLLQRARRDWGEIDTDTGEDETDTRAERLLQQYIDRYGSVGVRVEGATFPVEIPQAVEARRRLDSLPARRAEAERLQREKDELDRQLESTTHEKPRFAGLTADVDATLLQGHETVGSDAVVAEIGGLGPSLRLGAGLGLTGKLGLRAELGTVLVGSSAPAEDASGSDEPYVQPGGAWLALGEGSLLLTISSGRLDLGVGPLYAVGVGRTMGQDDEGVLARVKGTTSMSGGTAQVRYQIPISEKISLGPLVSGGAASGGDVLYTWASLGLSVGYGKP